MRHNREKDYFTAAAGFSEALWEAAHCFREKHRRLLGMSSKRMVFLNVEGFLKSPEYLFHIVINWSGTVALQKPKTDKT